MLRSRGKSSGISEKQIGFCVAWAAANATRSASSSPNPCAREAAIVASDHSAAPPASMRGLSALSARSPTGISASAYSTVYPAVSSEPCTSERERSGEISGSSAGSANPVVEWWT